MKGVDEALIVAVGVVLLLAFIVIGVGMMRGEVPDRPDVPEGAELRTVCSADEDCAASTDGTRCISISTVKGTQKSCGCFSSEDCLEGGCDDNAKNKCR